MTFRNINKIDTGKAWERLYLRLSEEDLLPAHATNKKLKFAVTSYKYILGIAATVAVIVIAITIYTPKDSLVSIYNDAHTEVLVKTFEDGSVAYLSSNSLLKYPETFLTDKREIYLDGSAFFDINSMSECPFYIDTKFFKIKVLGTSFNVNTSTVDNAIVWVDEGEVLIISKQSGEQINLSAGQMATMVSGSLSVEPSNINSYEMSTIRFVDERLETIIAAINKNKENKQIILSDNLNDKILTVSFTNQSIEEKINLICTALNLQYTIDNQFIYIFE